jgi:hypothetical protein
MNPVKTGRPQPRKLTPVEAVRSLGVMLGGSVVLAIVRELKR